MGSSESNRVIIAALLGNVLVAALSVDFNDALSAGEVETIVATLEDHVRKAHPEVVSLLIKPQKADRADFSQK